MCVHMCVCVCVGVCFWQQVCVAMTLQRVACTIRTKYQTIRRQMDTHTYTATTTATVAATYS